MVMSQISHQKHDKKFNFLFCSQEIKYVYISGEMVRRKPREITLKEKEDLLPRQTGASRQPGENGKRLR